MGDFHTLACEDFLISEPLTCQHKLIAVMDGCTMAKESVFASILIGKILRKTAKEYYYLDFVTPLRSDAKTLLWKVCKELFEQLTKQQHFLHLDKEELMCTLIIGIIDTGTKSAELLVVGDGLIVVDGEAFDFDQDDKPDYLGYHLEEDFEKWYAHQKQFVSVPSFADLSISTDGMYSFKNFENTSATLSYTAIIQKLLLKLPMADENNFLKRQIERLKREDGHFLTDDLAVIRLIDV